MRDRMTGSMKSINTDHYYIHKGIAYHAYIEIAEVGATPLEFSFKTPKGSFPHFKNLSLTALGGTCKVTVKRGTTANPLDVDSAGSAAGQLTGPHNLNDNSIRDTGVAILGTPTYNDSKFGEDWIKLQVVGDETNQYTSVAETQGNDNEEIVMKDDTFYIIKVERVGLNNPEDVFIKLFWYEEPSGLI